MWPLVAKKKNGTLEAPFIMLIISTQLLCWEFFSPSVCAKQSTTGKYSTLIYDSGFLDELHFSASLTQHVRVKYCVCIAHYLKFGSINKGYKKRSSAHFTNRVMSYYRNARFRFLCQVMIHKLINNNQYNGNEESKHIFSLQTGSLNFKNFLKK